MTSDRETGTPPLYACVPAAVLVAVRSAETGLDAAEAGRRLAEVGPNRLTPPRRRPAIVRLLGHFHNILIYILIAAAVVKAAYRDWLDFWVILSVAVVTALIGFIQEGQAERALAGIRGMLSPTAQVRRDGSWTEVPAEQVVPGDIVRVRAGDRVPADIRLLHEAQLEIDESALTGESVAAAKSVCAVPADAALGDRACIAYSATLVTRGSGDGVVIGTGADTEIGHIQRLITQAQPMMTPLTRQLNSFSTRVAILILLTAALMTVVGLLLHGQSAQSLLDSAITFAVAAVPEGLPAIVTITLALGVQQMAKQQAITRKLTAVETLGSVSTICSDKTGTLTLNEMTVREIVVAGEAYRVGGEGYRPEGEVRRVADGARATPDAAPALRALVVAMARCNDAALRRDGDVWSIVGSPTEGSLIALATKLRVDLSGTARLDELPFDSTHKLMAVRDRDADGVVRILVKGAPDRLLARCTRELAPDGRTSRPLDAAAWHARIDALGAKGLRVLAAAWMPSPGAGGLDRDRLRELTFLGVVGIVDPPRPEAIEAIRRCRDAGIRVTMITGDHATTAAAIAADLGLAENGTPEVVTGAEVDTLSDAELTERAPSVDVFARTSPEHKIRVVRALQTRGRVVAMTGDGVNDAPALTRADVGIAMGVNGTEVTKDAADIVLADDNFATIEQAVSEGRRIFDNIQKSVMFILPTTFGQALIVLTAVLVGFDPPLQPTQVLWVNLVTAITLSFALAYEPPEPGIMQRPPRSTRGSVIDNLLLPRIVWATLLIAVATVAVFFTELGLGGSFATAQTSAITMLVMGQVAYLFNSRFLRRTGFTWRVLLGNRMIWVMIGVLAVLQLTFTYAPFMQTWFHTTAIGVEEWVRIGVFSAGIFVAVEVEKWFASAARRRRAR